MNVKIATARTTRFPLREQKYINAIQAKVTGSEIRVLNKLHKNKTCRMVF